MNATHKTEVKNQQISIEIENEAGDFHAPGNNCLLCRCRLSSLRWLCIYIGYIYILVYIYIYIVVLTKYLLLITFTIQQQKNQVDGSSPM